MESLKLHFGKYYCKSCSQHTLETSQRIKKTIKERYGVDSLMQCKEIVNKIKATNLEHFGCEYSMQAASVKEKAKESYKNNGTFCGFEDPKVLEKAQNTLANSGKVLTSSQQIKLFHNIKEHYPNSECILNKPCSNLNLDIALNINGVLIDIEVDGVYWHNNTQKDRKRDEFVKSLGYKVLRIRFNHKLPDNNIIYDGIQKLIETEHSFFQINSKDIKQIIT